jgi:hypothetical protein
VPSLVPDLSLTKGKVNGIHEKDTGIGGRENKFFVDPRIAQPL